jgi:hypothetical protein
MAGAGFGEGELLQFIQGFAAYLQQQKEQYLPSSVPLSPGQHGAVAGFFSAPLLQSVRIVELLGNPMPTPPESMRAEVSRHVKLPEIEHMDSFTFVNVVLFRDTVAERRLFHALVHVAQFALLGVEPYLGLYIRAFLKSRSYLTVPLEMHAFRLDARFAEAPSEVFSVEDEIRLWQAQGRY